MDHLLSFAVNPGDSGYQTSRTVAYFDEIQRALSTVPGVKSAALVSNPLLGNWVQSEGFTIPDRASGGQNLGSTVLTVSETFFGTIGIPIIAGRDFRANDADGTLKVIIVNESFTRKFLAGVIPVGRTIKFGDTVWQIVGICRDSKCFDIKKEIDPTTYFPFRQHPIGRASIAVRTLVSPSSVSKEVLSVATGVDANVPVGDMSTEEEMRDRDITPERMLASCCSLLAACVMLLSSIGLFGLMAYDVARRTSEFGVRMALGARNQDVLSLVMKEGLALVATGTIVGMGGAWMGSRLLAAMNSSVGTVSSTSTSNPTVLFGAPLLLALVAVIACYLPARKSISVDPVVVLRQD